jgi:TPP-dependent pyruvate/acetoin dehydrogenase alpha subunit
VPLEELTDWMRRDPIDGFAEFLRGGGLWDDAVRAEMLARVDARVERIVDRALDQPVSADGLFDHLYAERSPRLERQHRDLQDRIRGS